MRITIVVLQAAVAASARFVRHSCLALSSTQATIMSISGGGEVMQVKKLSDNAIMPVRGSEHAAGFDLASAYDTTVPAGHQGLIKTDLSIAIPPNTYARIAPRSGLAVKKMIDVGAGVVDYDYRGPVGVVVFNHGKEDFRVGKGDRVAQLILERISMAELQEVTELPETTRGSGGFGSTGVARSALHEVTSVANGHKKLKSMEKHGAEYVAYLLELVSDVSRMLDVDSTSPSVSPLREKALHGSLVMGNALEGAMERYEASNNMEELKFDVSVIIKMF